jgi:hypothetical protein
MHSRVLRTLLAAVFLSYIFIPTASAWGVSPGRIERFFSPNLTETFDIAVYNTESRYIGIDVGLDGDLAQYFEIIDDRKFTLGPGERRNLRLRMSLPAELHEPGLHDTRLRVVERLPEDVTGISTTVAYSIQLWISVPYPGKYLTAQMLPVSNVDIGEPVNFKMTLKSYGTEDVTASATIDIINPADEKLTTLHTGETLVEAKGTATLTSRLNTAGYEAGKYRAWGTVEYGGDKPATPSISFNVGDILIKILNVTYDRIEPDTISKLNVIIESYWNDRIEDVYISLLVQKDGVTAAEGTSESFGINPWKVKTVPVYLDTHGLEDGIYQLNVTVHYSGKETEKTIEVEIRSQSWLLYILIIIIIAAIIAAAIALYWYKVKKKVKRK